MEDKNKLSSQESLDIILKMVSQAKVNFRQSSFHLLLWGWLVLAASLGHFLLLKFSAAAQPEMAWFLMIPGVFVSMIYGFREGRREKVSTYADRIYMWTWMSFLISMFLLQFLMFEDEGRIMMIVILVLCGYATFLSGQILQFRPLLVGGILFWVFSILAFWLSNEYNLLVMAASVLTGYLIPGHLLRRKIRNVAL